MHDTAVGLGTILRHDTTHIMKRSNGLERLQSV